MGLVKRGLPALAYPSLEQAIGKDSYVAGRGKDRARQALQKALQLSASFTGASEATRTIVSLAP